MRSNFAEWVSEMRRRLDDDPRRGLLYVVFTLYLTVWYALTSRFDVGENVYEEDWDLLVVLDACRVDTLREVADEYDYIDTVDTKWSIGSQSDEWMAKTFTEKWRDQIAGTRYVTGNGHAEYVFENRDYPPKNNTTPLELASWDTVTEEAFFGIDNVWRTTHDETYGVVLPDRLTDHAIAAGREGGHERLVVHYMQPHLPYIGDAVSEGREPTELERRGYELLEEDEATRDEVYPLYRETLRYVLDDVERLLDNVDAENVAITADHGEAFGEWFAYGHPEGFLHPAVKQVPWVETSAVDSGTADPDLEAETTGESIAVEDHLRDLGYM
jgi:arylsulfatase A-like enzyme